MMGKTGKFVHRIRSTVNTTFDTNYGTDKKLEINLNLVDDGGSASSIKTRRIYSGNIQLVRLKGTISGDATSVILKGYEDENGTRLLLPPSQSTLENAVGDSTVSCTFKVDIFHAAPNDNLYIFAKTDAGTFTVTEVQVAWFE
jgi:hypothetical protein